MCFEFRDTSLVDTFMSDNQLNMKDGACFQCETFLDVVVLTDFRKLRENVVLNYGRVMCFQFRNTPLSYTIVSETRLNLSDGLVC